MRAEAATVTVAQGQGAADGLGQLRGDGQAQAGAAGAAVARVLYAVEGLQYRVEFFGGNPRALVEHADNGAVAGTGLHLKLRCAGELQGIVDQVH
ncbi:hypothetical protein D3C80_1371730 [compost metagenome]